MESTLKTTLTKLKDYSEQLRIVAKTTADENFTVGVLGDVGHMIESEIEHTFEVQGPGWKKLADSTIESKKRRGIHPIRILQDSKGMLESLKVKIDKPKKEVTIALGKTVRTKNGETYNLATIHHYGRKDKSIPARPIFSITRDFRRDVMKLFKSSTFKEMLNPGNRLTYEQRLARRESIRKQMGYI